MKIFSEISNNEFLKSLDEIQKRIIEGSLEKSEKLFNGFLEKRLYENLKNPLENFWEHHYQNLEWNISRENRLKNSWRNSGRSLYKNFRWYFSRNFKQVFPEKIQKLKSLEEFPEKWLEAFLEKSLDEFPVESLEKFSEELIMQFLEEFPDKIFN